MAPTTPARHPGIGTAREGTAVTDNLATAIADQLRRTGEARTPYHSHHERDQLRRAGRRAGRTLDRRVRTFDVPAEPHPHCDRDQCGTVAVILPDWGTNPLEARLTQSRANNAIDRALAAPDQR